jgi:hypothetical protein
LLGRSTVLNAKLWFLVIALVIGLFVVSKTSAPVCAPADHTCWDTVSQQP